MPLCIRCTAIYHFLLLALAAGLVAGRPTWKRALPVAGLAAVIGCTLVIGQWLGAQLGLWLSTPVNRTLSGLACGSGLGWLLSTAFASRFARGSRPRWLGIALFAVLGCASAAILLAAPPWPAAAHVLGIGSLAGFFGALAAIQAILLSYVLKGSDGSPRGALIALVAGVALIVEAVAMSLVRI
jgi:hypothetical protein